MKRSKIIMAICAIPLLLVASGCASTFIGSRAGVERVSLADANQVTNCQSIGQDTITVVAKVWFFPRSPEDVEANLYQVAVNYAVDHGADSVVKGESKEFGTRSFSFYKCRP